MEFSIEQKELTVTSDSIETFFPKTILAPITTSFSIDVSQEKNTVSGSIMVVPFSIKVSLNLF